MVDWGREDVMRQMMAGDNLALITPRQHKGDFGALATRRIGAHKTVSAYDINSYFPLYLHPSIEDDDQRPRIDLAHARRPNLHPRLLSTLSDAYGHSVTAEELFHYVYAVLYTPAYRGAYADFLRIDFARIPFPAELSLFEAMAALGERLVALHLLESSELDSPSVHFDGEGDNRVARKRSGGFAYDPDAERIGINATQHFAPIPPALWDYRIGGYQVLDKWLKDRKDRKLSTDDIQTYCRIATALAKTIDIQAELADLYPRIEDDLLNLRLA